MKVVSCSNIGCFAFLIMPSSVVDYSKWDALGDSSDSDDESDDDDFKGEGGKINHDHLFAQSKGGAQVAQGDDDFDEEMGGESQIIEVCLASFCAKCCVC